MLGRTSELGKWWGYEVKELGWARTLSASETSRPEA